MNNKIKKIIIATGGTGGHIFPAYSLAKHFIDKKINVKIISDDRGLKYLKDYDDIKDEKFDEKVLTPQLFDITLQNDEKIEINLENVYGHPKVPLTEKEYLNKFHLCCSASSIAIDKTSIQQLADFILSIEKKESVVDLFEIFN